MSRPYRWLCLVMLMLPVSGTGCNRETYGVVEGVVTLDGMPLSKTEVVFMPDPEKGMTGKRSVALTDEQGHYRITSDAGRAGAPVGFHRVCFNDMTVGPQGGFPGAPMPVLADNPGEGVAGTKDPSATPGVPAPGGGQMKARFPSRYCTPNSTPFRNVEVKEGDQTLNFDLKSN